MTKLPCSAYIVVSKGKHKGEKRYCEQGEEGHWGTCCGDRTEDEYQRLVREARHGKKR